MKARKRTQGTMSPQEQIIRETMIPRTNPAKRTKTKEEQELKKAVNWITNVIKTVEDDRLPALMTQLHYHLDAPSLFAVTESLVASWLKSSDPLQDRLTRALVHFWPAAVNEFSDRIETSKTSASKLKLIDALEKLGKFDFKFEIPLVHAVKSQRRGVGEKALAALQRITDSYRPATLADFPAEPVHSHDWSTTHDALSEVATPYSAPRKSRKRSRQVGKEAIDAPVEPFSSNDNLPSPTVNSFQRQAQNEQASVANMPNQERRPDENRG